MNARRCSVGTKLSYVIPESEQAEQLEVGLIIDELCMLRKQMNLNDIDWKALRDDGQR